MDGVFQAGRQVLVLIAPDRKIAQDSARPVRLAAFVVTRGCSYDRL